MVRYRTNIRWGGKMWLLDVYMHNSESILGWWKPITHRFKTYEQALAMREKYK